MELRSITLIESVARELNCQVSLFKGMLNFITLKIYVTMRMYCKIHSVTKGSSIIY